MKMTNLEIYNTASHLMEAFSDGNQKLPVKLNFFLQKNKKTLLGLAQEIEEARLNIAKEFGVQNENGGYTVEPENVNKAQAELTQLFNIEQEVDIAMINYDDLDPSMTMTAAQMEALLFMIK